MFSLKAKHKAANLNWSLLAGRSSTLHAFADFGGGGVDKIFDFFGKIHQAPPAGRPNK